MHKNKPYILFVGCQYCIIYFFIAASKTRKQLKDSLFCYIVSFGRKAMVTGAKADGHIVPTVRKQTSVKYCFSILSPFSLIPDPIPLNGTTHSLIFPFSLTQDPITTNDTAHI